MEKEKKERKEEKKKREIEIIDEGIGLRVDSKIKAGQVNARGCCNSPIAPVI